MLKVKLHAQMAMLWREPRKVEEVYHNTLADY